ncbi:hypothetical protein [Methanobacterium formicicum]|nr:hypothetical protein [Methanobacterium formicicum]
MFKACNNVHVPFLMKLLPADIPRQNFTGTPNYHEVTCPFHLHVEKACF